MESVEPGLSPSPVNTNSLWQNFSDSDGVGSCNDDSDKQWWL